MDTTTAQEPTPMLHFLILTDLFVPTFGPVKPREIMSVSLREGEDFLDD